MAWRRFCWLPLSRTDDSAENDCSARPLTHNVQYEQAEHREARRHPWDAGRGQQPALNDAHGGLLDHTVSKLLLDIGAACAACQDEHLCDLPCKTIEADEIWSFVYAKQKNVPEEFKGQFGIGDVWTWTALCADTKLIASWYVGGRDHDDAAAFLFDLKGRLSGRIQLTTDGHAAYESSVGLVFRNEVDWAQLGPTWSMTGQS